MDHWKVTIGGLPGSDLELDSLGSCRFLREAVQSFDFESRGFDNQSNRYSLVGDDNAFVPTCNFGIILVV